MTQNQTLKFALMRSDQYCFCYMFVLIYNFSRTVFEGFVHHLAVNGMMVEEEGLTNQLLCFVANQTLHSVNRIEFGKGIQQAIILKIAETIVM